MKLWTFAIDAAAVLVLLNVVGSAQAKVKKETFCRQLMATLLALRC